MEETHSELDQLLFEDSLCFTIDKDAHVQAQSDFQLLICESESFKMLV